MAASLPPLDYASQPDNAIVKLFALCGGTLVGGMATMLLLLQR